jgi:UDP-N-acetylmuramoylalanine--D-glutamate ligase
MAEQRPVPDVAAADLAGLRVTVMGLGLHGGGLASALFFARRGADVTVTDLKDAAALAASLEPLAGLPARLVLGRHDEADFASADVVIKNPGVRPSSPFLQVAKSKGVPIETDISVFLRCALPKRLRVVAVTGSKGKSTTATAIHHVLTAVEPGSRLGGNITVSPLRFVDELAPGAAVVLELSSWQLGDLKGKGLLDPEVSLVTNLLPDHMNYYGSMEDYVADKKVIFEEQTEGHSAVFNGDDPLQAQFARETRARTYAFAAGGPRRGGWLEGDTGLADVGAGREVVLADSPLPGRHNRLNLLAAAVVLRVFGVDAARIRERLAGFRGLEHRLEPCRELGRVRFYNDSAATMPHATAEALQSLPPPVFLIAGGTDKNIDFAPLVEPARRAAAIFLLEGNGTVKLKALLDGAGIASSGPYPSLEAVVAAAAAAAAGAGAAASVLFSPGCTSFGMFQNEFDRGRRFKALVAAL